MSRLDSFIQRMSAQRDILNDIQNEVRAMPGNILELGLGNGRTYDHLRQLFPDRRVIVFDRDPRAFPGATPSAEDMIAGEISETIKNFLGQNAALVHADIGTGYDDRDAVTLTWLPDRITRALGPGGIAISGLPLEHPSLVPQPRLPSVPEGRYFHYRRASQP